MTNKEIIEGNKLIAEFLGIRYHPNETVSGYPSCLPLKMGEDKIENFKFHSSWDWLIPVVEKIESTDPLGGIVIIQQGMCKITSRMAGDNSIRANNDNYLLMGTKGKLLSTFQSVVQYIKWYNENKKE